jgi:hypothetical protein
LSCLRLSCLPNSFFIWSFHRLFRLPNPDFWSCFATKGWMWC